MKSMQPPSAAIFFMTYFHRARGAMAPLAPPPDPLLRIGNGGMGMQPLVPSAVPCPCSCLVCIVTGIMYKPIVSGPGPGPGPVPGPVQCE